MKTLFAVLSVALAALLIAPHSYATTPSNNTASYLNYANGPDPLRWGTQANPVPGAATNTYGQWWATEGQPNKTFHLITVRDSSGCAFQLGHGTSPTQVVDLDIAAAGSATAGSNDTQTVQYNFGLSYGGSTTCIWWRSINCTPVQGEQIINFIY